VAVAWSAERRAATVLAFIAIAEAWWIYINLRISPTRFWRFLGFTDHAGGAGWVLAVAVFAGYTVYSLNRFPSVRAHAGAWSSLKALGIAVAVTAALCEEGIFRKFLMDRLAATGYGIAPQMIASALAFGSVHGVWGLFRGSIVAAMGATAATALLGLALAAVYIASHRVLAPCVVSHFLIDMFIEPGLMLAAMRGEMSHRTTA
jgi:CAAX protease family protein